MHYLKQSVIFRVTGSTKAKNVMICKMGKQ